MKIFGTLSVFLILGGPASAGSGLLNSIQDDIKDLISKDTDARVVARDKIQQQFDLSTAPDKKAAVDELLLKLKASPNPTEKLTAAITLSKLKSPWEASDHETKVKDLYQMFLSSSDPTFARYLDDALSNAKGLYLDAINDFNGDNVENPDRTAKKFLRMPDEFPKSRYASSSAYYLGQYWTRVALIKQNADLYIPKSDLAFTSFIERSRKREFATSDFVPDAFYFMALNRILAGKENEALAQLDGLSGTMNLNQNIYIYQLFYKRSDKSTEIDRYINIFALINMTTKFIRENPGSLPGAQSRLASQLLLGK